MTGKETFKIWAPVGAKWTDWTRPVPFIAIDEEVETNEFFDFTLPKINYINEVKNDTAIIIDLPNYNSIKEGISLAKIGYRPIPVFNGTNEQPGSLATTNNHIIEPALIYGAKELKKIKIEQNAPPTFLLSSDRMNRYKMNASIFDNSWDIYPQDIPSPKYFLKNGINKIIVRGEKIQKDLSKILYKFQKEKIKIFFTNGYEEPINIIIKKPSRKDK